MKNNLTFIIPIHELKDNKKIYLIDAIQSLNQQTNKNFDVLLVIPKDGDYIYEFFKSHYKGKNLSILKKSRGFEYEKMVNFAANKCNTPYFTVLQYDDILNTQFVDIFSIYLKENPQGIYLTLSIDKIGENTHGMKNESFWAYSTNMGHVDSEKMEHTGNASLVGAIFEKQVFLDLKGFKPYLEVFSEHEFILRYINSIDDPFVIPKIMTYHQIGLEDSILKTFSEKNDHTSQKALLIKAKQEYKILPKKINT